MTPSALSHQLSDTTFVYRKDLSVIVVASHMYLAHTEPSGEDYFAWITDEASGAVVAGQIPPR